MCFASKKWNPRRLRSAKVKPHVQKTYPLEEAAQALDSVKRGDSVAKIVLTVE